MATAAYHSPEPVLNNRFVRVFYYRPPPANSVQRGAMIGQRGRGSHMRGGHGRGGHIPTTRGHDEAVDAEPTEQIDPESLGELKRTVNNVQVEEPKIVEEARNKQKEKRSEAVQQEHGSQIHSLIRFSFPCKVKCQL